VHAILDPSESEAKGQLISEQIFQKCNEIIAKISAIASKMGQIKKSKGTLSS
jgi:predicted transcriptional regulator